MYARLLCSIYCYKMLNYDSFLKYYTIKCDGFEFNNNDNNYGQCDDYEFDFLPHLTFLENLISDDDYDDDIKINKNFVIQSEIKIL